jgi:hypothetical protein
MGRPGGVEHSPDDLAVVGGKNTEGAREAGDRGEPSPVLVEAGEPLTGQVEAVVSNGQTQGLKVPGDRQVDVAAGMNRRVGHELADHQGS